MKYLFLSLIVVLLLSSCSNEQFDGEKEFLAPFFEDMENPDNFQIHNTFMDKGIKHKEKGYVILYDTDICEEYTVICNNQKIYNVDCGVYFISRSWVEKFAHKAEEVYLHRLLNKMNCHKK